MHLRTWLEPLGDFDLRSPTLGLGDIQFAHNQLQVSAVKGVWVVTAKLQTDLAPEKCRYLFPLELEARHMFWEDGRFEWSTSTVIADANYLVGFWDQSRYADKLELLAQWSKANVVAASLLGSYGAICETLSGPIVVMTATVHGEAVAVKVMTSGNSKVAHADIEHRVQG